MAEEKKKDDELGMADILRSALRYRLKRYIDGMIKSHITAAHIGPPKKKKVQKEDEAPTNVMGSGQVATFDPLLFVKAAKRKKAAQIGV